MNKDLLVSDARKEENTKNFKVNFNFVFEKVALKLTHVNLECILTALPVRVWKLENSIVMRVVICIISKISAWSVNMLHRYTWIWEMEQKNWNARDEQKGRWTISSFGDTWIWFTIGRYSKKTDEWKLSL